MCLSKEIATVFPNELYQLIIYLGIKEGDIKANHLIKQYLNKPQSVSGIILKHYVWLSLPENIKHLPGLVNIKSSSSLAKPFHLGRFTLQEMKELVEYIYANHGELPNADNLHSMHIHNNPVKIIGNDTLFWYYMAALEIFIESLKKKTTIDKFVDAVRERKQKIVLIKEEATGSFKYKQNFQKFMWGGVNSYCLYPTINGVKYTDTTSTLIHLKQIIAEKPDCPFTDDIKAKFHEICFRAEHPQLSKILPPGTIQTDNPDADMTPSRCDFQGNLITLENLGEPFWCQNYGKAGEFIRTPGSTEWIKLEFKSVPRHYAPAINAFLNTCDVVRISPGCYFCKAQATGSRKDDARVCTRCLFEKHTGTKVPGTSRLTITGCNPTASHIIKFFQSQEYDATKTPYEIWAALNNYLLDIAEKRGEYDTADYSPTTFVSPEDKCVVCYKLVGEKGGNILYRLHANCALASMGKTFADVHNFAIQVLSTATEADFSKTDITTMGVNAFRLIQDMRSDGCPYECVVCGGEHASGVGESLVYKHDDGKLYLALPENGVIIDTLTENPINDDLYPELIQKFLEKIKEFLPRTHGSLTKGAAARH